MSIIKTENLSYIYGEGTPFKKIAVDNINIEIEQGELLGIIGHTGSGKSTLIQQFNGLLKPTSGKIYLNNVDIHTNKTILKETRFKVGLVFQYPEYQLFEETVFKDIAFGPTNMGLSESQIKQSVLEAAELVGISNEILGKSPFDLSGGQKRRVAIACVIAMKPEVLILDEPTAGLDPKGRDKILNLIKDYHLARKNTILLVSHSMEDIAQYATKILCMNNGKVYSYSDVKTVFGDINGIEKIGLSVPQITKAFHKLKEKGYNVDPNIFDIEAAKAEILRMLQK